MEVREARAAEATALGRSLADAFRDDPIQRWMLPSERDWNVKSARQFALLVRRALAVGRVYTSDALEGAAIWLPPGADFARGAGGLDFALRSMLLLRLSLPRAARLGQLLAPHHPREPHAYLPVLGTAPASQRRGVGSALLAAELARCDAEGIPAYLESSKAANLPFYERHGFEAAGAVRIPGGPEFWPMRRAPRSRGAGRG